MNRLNHELSSCVGRRTDGIAVLLLKLLQLDTAGVARTSTRTRGLAATACAPSRKVRIWFAGAGAKTGERGAFSGVGLIESVNETIDLKHLRMYGRHRPFPAVSPPRRAGIGWSPN
jgi:hypothetical protein